MFRPSSYLAGSSIPDIRIAERRRSILVVTPFSAAADSGIERAAQKLIEEISTAANFDFVRATTPLSSSPLARLRGTYAQFYGLRRRIEHADLVWLHDASSFASVAAFRIAKRLKKPVFVTQHKGPNDRTRWTGKLWGAIADRIFAQDIMQGAKQASFTSDAAAHYYYRRVAFTAPVKIIPNGADLQIFYPATGEERMALRAQFALRDTQPVLIYAGSFDSADDMEAVRAIAAYIPDWRFWLIGDGKINPEAWYLPNVQTFRKRSGADLARLYQTADLMILPVNGSLFPLAAQEAMACGLPVMCSPSLASGSDFAKPYLWMVEVFAGAPKRTAALWADKLSAGRKVLPLAGAKTELSDLAQSFWEWPRIAGYYAEILRGICKPVSVARQEEESIL